MSNRNMPGRAIRAAAAAAAAALIHMGAAAPALAATVHHAVHAAAPLRPGDYVCQAKGAGMFPISILAGGRYHAAAKPGHYRSQAGLIGFTGGSLANQVGHLTSPTSFELGLNAHAAPYTTCDLAEKPTP
jgi:hypothetical protein